MILFHAKRDGTVETTPLLVPQGSSMQDLTVVSEFDYAYCSIMLEPASGVYIPDVVCTPILTTGGSTIWTASFPAEATKVAGKVGYQIIFTAADGTRQETLEGTITVPRRIMTNMPDTVEGLQQATIGELYALLSNIYAVYVGLENPVYKLLANMTEAGTVTIPTTEWSDYTPRYAIITDDVVDLGAVTLFFPANDKAKTAFEQSGLTLRIDSVVNDMGVGDYVAFVLSEGGTAPDIDLHLNYVKIKTGTDEPPKVALIGVDAAGGVDESAVKDIIKGLLPEWTFEKDPPKDAVPSVNGMTGEVTLTYEDVGADKSGAAAAVAEKVAADLASYYKKTETLSKSEINALVSAIPKFEIKVVSALPTSGISLTTVYLVKNKSESGDLYTEYIYTNGAWEELGRQRVDLTDYARKADLPTALPNPAVLTILGKTYNGSEAMSVTINDILAALPASEEVAV